MEYKTTLNLPKTDFPMKAGLAQKEPEYLKNWESDGLYSQILANNQEKPTYILHDGPPYANGHIHFGHILNKILKDIIIKAKNMAGFQAPYVPGWDCHGLPIELGAIKELKAQSDNTFPTALEKRQACREYAGRFINDQREQFKRLGIFGEWDNPYLTLTNQYEADIAREFVKLYLTGSVYQGKKPVYWCYSCQTALAEAEVEYDDQTSPSIYVKFALPEASALGGDFQNKKVSLVIWTTTPWTLPANLALAIGPDYEYAAYSVGDDVLIVAEDLSASIFEAIGVESPPEKLVSWSGRELIEKKLICEHPFLKRQSPVLEGHHVTLESGTGVVHIAPGHGQDDYVIGQKNGLETLCPVDHEGKLLPDSLATARFDEIREWEGAFVKKVNKLLIHFLKEQNILLSDVDLKLKHSYPHCWRCKNPIIFRATEQWFCSLSHNDLRQKALTAIDKDVNWIPNWGHDRIYGMIENRPDWCLSRQRIWGVPIIIHYCGECRKPHLDQQSGDYIVAQFEEKGADAWWVDDKALLPEGVTCACGSQDFVKEQSILDVWFDSGVSHAAVLDKRDNLSFPADLYLEGSDQHRGWFHSSLLTSLATKDQVPYKAVLTHGFVVDGKGKKYSKSAKNYVPPDKIINERGAELLRLWVAAEDYRNDIRVSDEIMKVLSEVYRKIRNTCRFFLGNLSDFDATQNYVPAEKRTELDRYALHLTAQIVDKVQKAYDDYEFHVVHHSLNKFFTVELSAQYLDILKDRLYCDKTDGFLRRSAQSSLYDILTTIVPLMSPILSFTSEEIWKFMAIPNKPASVFLSQFAKVPENWLDNKVYDNWQRLYQIRDDVLKVLEQARQDKTIAHSLDAKVKLEAPAKLFDFMNQYKDEWTQILICSQVELVRYDGSDLKISVATAEGGKCQRCWNYSTALGQSSQHPDLCARCVTVLS